MLKKYIFFGLVALACLTSTESTRPNIIIFMADDLGWNDVSYHDPLHQIPTPNIDALGLNGVILNRHYSMHLCTPSRAALMTGKYPVHTGMQHHVIFINEPWGLPVEEKLMPEYFKDANYSTYMVGKWHLGFHKKIYTPLGRGFDHHFGYWGQNIDYWTKKAFMPGYGFGLDFRNESQTLYDDKTYATESFTQASIKYIKNHDKQNPMFMLVNHLAPHTGNPNDLLQAPEEEIEKFSYIPDKSRRIYAAMVSLLDKSIGEVISALKDNQMLDNSVIVFLSDNGAPLSILNGKYGGSNYPLRGEKSTAWEGGVRTPAVIWSPLIQNQRSVSNELFHISDWLPTLLSAAGVVMNPKIKQGLDGIDQWKSLVEGIPTSRTKLLLNIDPIAGWSSIIKDNWKLVNKSSEPYDGWLSNVTTVTNLTSHDYAKLVTASDVSVAIQSNLTADELLKMSPLSHLICTSAPDRADTVFNCNPDKSPCLFNLDVDPCEYYNLARIHPLIVHDLMKEIHMYEETMIPPLNLPSDPKCHPKFYNNTWTNWSDYAKNIGQ